VISTTHPRLHIRIFKLYHFFAFFTKNAILDIVFIGLIVYREIWDKGDPNRKIGARRREMWSEAKLANFDL